MAEGRPTTSSQVFLSVMVSGLTVLKIEMVIWIPGYRLSLTTCSSARDLAQARKRTVGIWDGTRTGLHCPRVNSARANPTSQCSYVPAESIFSPLASGQKVL